VLATTVERWLPDVRDQWRGRAALVRARRCGATLDAFCVDRELAASRRLGATPTDLDAVRAWTIDRARTDLRQRIASAQGAGSPRDRLQRLDAVSGRQAAMATAFGLAPPPEIAVLEVQRPVITAAVRELERREAATAAVAQAQREADDRRRVAREAREERQRQQREEREERERCNETVMCCDGTRSPTCSVCRSSMRGCCSHHGGIC